MKKLTLEMRMLLFAPWRSTFAAPPRPALPRPFLPVPFPLLRSALVYSSMIVWARAVAVLLLRFIRSPVSLDIGHWALGVHKVVGVKFS